MKITWIGHSCFKIEEGGYRIILDPYEDNSVPGSHEHGDHNARERVALVPGVESPFTVTRIETYHDPLKGVLRGRNTIHILATADKRIAHFGDLGCSLTSEQLAQLKDLDIAIIPVGGHYTIDAAQAAALVRKINPVHVIPMHYRGEGDAFGFGVIGTVKQFTDQMDSVTFIGGSTLDLDTLPAEQVLVLNPQNLD